MAAEMAGPMALGTAEGAALAGTVAAFGQAGPQAAAAGRSSSRYQRRSWLDLPQMWYRQGAGMMRKEMIRQGVDPDWARGISLGAAAPYAALEFLQVRKILGPLGDKIMREAAQGIARTVPPGADPCWCRTGERHRPGNPPKRRPKRLLPSPPKRLVDTFPTSSRARQSKEHRLATASASCWT